MLEAISAMAVESNVNSSELEELLATLICTYNSQGELVCVEKKEPPSCVGRGPFECSKPAPAGVKASVFSPSGKIIWGNLPQNDLQIALTCKLGEKLVTDENGKQYCQSTDIGG